MKVRHKSTDSIMREEVIKKRKGERKSESYAEEDRRIKKTEKETKRSRKALE